MSTDIRSHSLHYLLPLHLRDCGHSFIFLSTGQLDVLFKKSFTVRKLYRLYLTITLTYVLFALLFVLVFIHLF